MVNYDDIYNSTFQRMKNGSISVSNAVLMWPNFKGAPTQNHPKGGYCTVNIGLTKVVAEALMAEGWNIKPIKNSVGDDGVAQLYSTELKVNMDSEWPPKIYIITEWNGEKSSIKVSNNTPMLFNELDEIIKNGQYSDVDIQIHPYRYDGQNYAYKGYVNELYITKLPNSSFGGKYAWIDIAETESPQEDVPLPFN